MESDQNSHLPTNDLEDWEEAFANAHPNGQFPGFGDAAGHETWDQALSGSPSNGPLIESNVNGGTASSASKDTATIIEPAKPASKVNNVPSTEEDKLTYEAIFSLRPLDDDPVKQEEWMKQIWLPYHNRRFSSEINTGITWPITPSSLPASPNKRKRPYDDLEDDQQPPASSRHKKTKRVPPALPKQTAPPWDPRFASGTLSAPPTNTALWNQLGGGGHLPSQPMAPGYPMYDPYSNQGNFPPYPAPNPFSIPPRFDAAIYGASPQSANNSSYYTTSASASPGVGGVGMQNARGGQRQRVRPTTQQHTPPQLSSSSNAVPGRANHGEFRRRLAIGPHWHEGGATTLKELAEEYGLSPARHALNNRAKDSLRNWYHETDMGFRWITEWVKSQKIILRKEQPPVQFKGESEKQSRIGTEVENTKMAIFNCFRSWRDEQGLDGNQKALEKLIRSFPGDQPMLPDEPNHLKAHAAAINRILQAHPWYLDPSRAEERQARLEQIQPYLANQQSPAVASPAPGPGQQAHTPAAGYAAPGQQSPTPAPAESTGPAATHEVIAPFQPAPPYGNAPHQEPEMSPEQQNALMNFTTTPEEEEEDAEGDSDPEYY